MCEDPDRESELGRLLRGEPAGVFPEPSGDLAARTIRRVQDFVLMVDLIRLVTFEAFWKATKRDDADAAKLREGQDS